MKLTNYSSPFQSLYNKHHSYSLQFPKSSPYTKQSFKEECDINTIMGRYLASGEMPNLNQNPQYLDCSNGFDFQAMQDQVLQAEALFGQLPSVLRNRFANNPAEFLAYCADPANLPEMTKLGLLRPLPVSESTVVPEAQAKTE